MIDLKEIARWVAIAMVCAIFGIIFYGLYMINHTAFIICAVFIAVVWALLAYSNS